MGSQLSDKEILEQSRTAFAQWGEKWKAHAKINGEIFKKSGLTMRQLGFSGYGRQLIIVAMGASLERHIEYLKEVQQNPLIDIAVVDKGFKSLIEHGVKPKYVFLADAGIDFKQWLEPVIEDTKDVNLISNITANPDWTKSWKGPIYFYVNKDNINTQDIFIPLSGCTDIIPASSNVGNSVVVFAITALGYDEHLLVGYDFSWNADGNYYAFNDNDKRHWMRNLQGIGIDNKLIYTSSNLQFSRKWLEDFCNMASLQGIKVFNCSEQGVMNWRRHELKKRIAKFTPRPITPEVEHNKAMTKAKIIKMIGKDLEKGIKELIENNKILGAEIAFIPNEA